MDYQAVLKKYMKLVLDCGGTTFVHRALTLKLADGLQLKSAYGDFTEEEQSILATIDKELP